MTLIAKKTLTKNENRYSEYEINVTGNYVDIPNSRIHTSKQATPRKPSIPRLYLSDDSLISGVHGPNSTIDLETPGPPASERSQGHTTAWYHVPGRYSTPNKPFPSGRSKKRVGRLRSNFECAANSKTTPFMHSTRQDTV